MAVIAVDFDGTCVTHEYPAVGRNIGADIVLKALVDAEHKIILNTMRSGEYLEHAIYWFSANGIPLFGVNKNPEQYKWTTSPKVYAHLYIDDAALGCPLMQNPFGIVGSRSCVDWYVVGCELVKKQYLLNLPLSAQQVLEIFS